MKAKIVSIVILILLLLVTLSYTQKEIDWKGTIEKENGIEIIKNPAEPLYGEITLELEKDLEIGNDEDERYLFYKWARIVVDENENIYVLDAGTGLIKKYDHRGNHILTIGAPGQGPGEFFDPRKIVLDGSGLFYVPDSWEIEVFDHDWNFLKNFKPRSRISNFCVLDTGGILAQSFSGETHDVLLLDSDWREVKKIVSYPFIRDSVFANPYLPDLMFCSVNDRLVVYGYTSEYKLFYLDSSGSIIRVIEKEIRPGDKILTNREKTKYIDFMLERIKSNSTKKKPDRNFIEKYTKFYDEQALFFRLYSDDRSRIYVRQIDDPIIDEKQSEYDLFNEEGYYLHKIKLPFPVGIEFLGVIHSGYLYREEENQETGYIKIIRYKIKNWDQLKSGISN